MDSKLFKEWIPEFNRKFIAEKKKIVLLVETCPAHSKIDNLNFIEIIFQLPNTTVKLQLMYRGVICSLIAFLTVISILGAVKMVDLAW